MGCNRAAYEIDNDLPRKFGLYDFVGKTVTKSGSMLDHPYCKFPSEVDTYIGSAILKGFCLAAEEAYWGYHGISGYTLSNERYRTSHKKYKDKFWDKLPDTINMQDLMFWYNKCIKKAVYIRTDNIYAFDLRIRDMLKDFSGDYDKEFLDKITRVYNKYTDDTNNYLYVSGKGVKVFSEPPVHKQCIYIDEFSFNKEMFRRATETAQNDV